MFFHAILQAIFLKIPTKTLNYCQTIIRRKMIFLHAVIFQKNVIVAKKIIRHFSTRIENLFRHFTINKCTNIYKLQTFCHYFCNINTFYLNAKKRLR
jgi:hypothetical protein